LESGVEKVEIMKPDSKPPIDCTVEELCRMKYDHLDVVDFWIMPYAESKEVYIYQQNMGESPTQIIVIPTEKFRKMVKWITSPQKFVR